MTDEDLDAIERRVRRAVRHVLSSVALAATYAFLTWRVAATAGEAGETWRGTGLAVAAACFLGLTCYHAVDAFGGGSK